MKNMVEKIISFPVFLKTMMDKYFSDKSSVQVTATTGRVFQPICDEFVNNLNNKEEILSYLSKGGQRADCFNFEFWKDKETFKAIIENVKDSIEFAPRYILNNVEYAYLLLECKSFHPYFLSSLDSGITSNKDFAMKAIARDYYSVEYMGENIRKDPDVLKFLMEKFNYPIDNYELTKEDIESYKEYHNDDGEAFKKAHYNYRNNNDLAAYEVKRDVFNYIYLGSDLKLNKDFVCMVLDSEHANSLMEHIPEQILDKKLLVARVSLHNKESTNHLIENLKKDS